MTGPVSDIRKLKKGAIILMKKNHLKYQVFEEKYGDDKYQIGDIYIPNVMSKGTVCLLHGGFWKMPYDRNQLNGVAQKLAENNFSVWNIEYRRIGYIQNGYPEMFSDVINSINFLATLNKKYKNINLSPLYLAGHSAGGHLSLWLSNSEIDNIGIDIIPDFFIGLAPVVDLLKCYNSSDRMSFVYDFIKHTPSENIDIYNKLSPISLLPPKHKQIIFHGDKDEILPIIEINEYEQLAHKTGRPITLIKIENGKHMDFCDPDGISVSTFINFLNSPKI